MARRIEKARDDGNRDGPMLEKYEMYISDKKAMAADVVATLSTAEAISVALDAALHSRYFGSGAVSSGDIARNILGSLVKEDLADLAVMKEYVTLVAKKRAAKDATWQEFHDRMIEVLG